MSGASCQILDNATQFDGSPGRGLFSFAAYNKLPRTTRVQISRISYATDGAPGANPGDIDFYLTRPGGDPLERMLIGRFTQAEITGPNNDGDVTICGVIVPRDPGDQGQHWQLQAFSTGRDVSGAVCVDVFLQPLPDTSMEDSQQ